MAASIPYLDLLSGQIPCCVLLILGNSRIIDDILPLAEITGRGFQEKQLVCVRKLMHELSSASSTGNMEEGFFLQVSLDSFNNFLDWRNFGEATVSPYYLKSMTPSAFEATLWQKEGELSSYMSPLCEKLCSETATLPGIRADLEALRQCHTAALELMGERDEEKLLVDACDAEII
ncbi:hypothetical protein Ancab_029508 [Ancistrocladus abbreviatus]